MTYLTDEQAGKDPVELYEFTFGDQVWRYSDGDEPYLHPTTGDFYNPEMIFRGNMQQSEEDGSMSVKVTIDAKNPIADFFRTPYLPGRHIWLVIYGTHRGSVEEPGVRFRGVVGQCDFADGRAELMCLPLRHAIGRRVPIQLVQRLCTNTLYDLRCKVPLNTYAIEVTISDITGLAFTINVGTGHPDGFYDGGFIESGDKPLGTIKTQVGSVLNMLYNPGFVEGDVITLHVGCDKRYATCRDKFANTPNYQGFPKMPISDPFAKEVT